MNPFGTALRDFTDAFKYWRIAWLIGSFDIRRRYRRSRIGQFWLTLATGIFISALGLFWGLLLKVELSNFFPFVALGIVTWNFISSTITEGSNAFVSAERYIRELALPKTLYVWVVLIRNSIVFLHNLPVVVLVFAVYPPPFEPTAFLSVFGFALLLIFLFFLVLLIAVVSLRFRDMPNIIASLIQISFFVSPIIWQTEMMPQLLQRALILNPFAVFLVICRDPILGRPVPIEYWPVAIAMTVAVGLASVWMFMRFRKRIPYWL